MLFLRAVAGVEVAGDAFILKDNGPRDDGGIDGKKGATGGKGKRLHISHDTIDEGICTCVRSVVLIGLDEVAGD